MNNLVLDFLSKNEKPKPQKIVLNNNLKSKPKIIFLDRQVIKYFIKPEKYIDPKITTFRNNVLSDYDKSCNVITIMTAFYEGGSGNFESESQKRHTAIWDLSGLDQCFKYARVDENYIFKKMKKATHAFTLDSGIQEHNKKFKAIIRSTYGYYLELINNDFNGLTIIEFAKKLKSEMDAYKVSIGDPIAQYCFSLLTNHQNAKKIFKVKGLSSKSEEAIQRTLYNAYADLRVLQFINNFKSHIPNNVEVCFVSNDIALNQFYRELEGTVNKILIQKDKLDRISNLYNVEIDFKIFSSEKFNKNEFEDFKNLFFEWGD